MADHQRTLRPCRAEPAHARVAEKELISGCRAARQPLTKRQSDLAVFAFDGTRGRAARPGRATLAILTRLAGRSRFTTAIDGLANGHHRLLKLFERRLHALEIVGIKRTFDS